MEGRLSKRPGKSRRSRGYCLPPGEAPGPPPIYIPVLGRVQAGGLNAAIEYLEGHIPVQDKHSTSENLFGLRVQGESMTGAGILPGDIVIVRSQPTAKSGDIVVALLDDEATVKRLRIRSRRIELHPENPEFETIVPAADRCSILGKVIEVRRSFEKK